MYNTVYVGEVRRLHAITDLFSRSLSVFCGYLQNIRNPLKSSFAQSQPAYQMLLDLSDPI